ncbi:MAG: trypsin-like peptidase domain-containing protein [Candidatus Delongbacteria bacterium]|nr:trypsin-like peptidase domain-containing protein [Candidatus Delongbacteria bacterium]MCG2760515.1 trypsin-like peptidase domain-containing protein [Candidatus Delongbacteria bacterium]
MFIKGIEIASQFTRAIHTISRNIDSTDIIPGAATLFFVNSDGWALTCKHVVQHLIGSDQLQKRKNDYLSELMKIKGVKNERQLKKEVLKKFDYIKQPIYESYNCFMNCVDGNLQYEAFMHPETDVALIHFLNYSNLFCNQFPIFAKNVNELQQGKYLCRLGFPFPEFTNYFYDSSEDKIKWNQSGRIDSPKFPIEGMVTRHLVDSTQVVIGVEMSTPGLRGQSGGPLFDQNGIIWGMQSATNHLDLDFDVMQEVIRNGKKTKVEDHAFLHVGHCVHVKALKSFMKQHKVQFQEET